MGAGGLCGWENEQGGGGRSSRVKGGWNENYFFLFLPASFFLLSAFLLCLHSGLACGVCAVCEQRWDIWLRGSKVKGRRVEKEKIPRPGRALTEGDPKRDTRGNEAATHPF